jgi:hypothetical protein
MLFPLTEFAASETQAKRLSPWGFVRAYPFASPIESEHCRILLMFSTM